MTRGALAAPCREVNAAFGEVLARCVVLELVLGHLEADEMLERRVGDGRADRRIGQRIDRRVGLARPCAGGSGLRGHWREASRRRD